MERELAKKGLIVKHIKKGYVGLLDDFTKIKVLFEDSNDEVEYRVVVDGTIEIASLNNLELVENQSKYANTKRSYTHCFNCKTIIDKSSRKCPICGWYICEICNKCGCSYDNKRTL